MPLIYEWFFFLSVGVYSSMKWCLLVLIFLLHMRRTISVLLITGSCWLAPFPDAFSCCYKLHMLYHIPMRNEDQNNCLSQELSLLLLFYLYCCCVILKLYLPTVSEDIGQSARRIVTFDVHSCSSKITDTWNQIFRAEAHSRIYLIKIPNFTKEELYMQESNSTDTANFQPLSS